MATLGFLERAYLKKIQNPFWESSAFSYVLSLSIITVVYGAIPGLAIPSLGQILWASGFAESFANSGGLATTATNFGIPDPASLPLGLPGALLQSLLIQSFNIHSSDAYSATAVFWLAVALLGAIRLCQLLGGSFRMGAALAPIYLTLPIVWGHAGYSYVSFGFALLPLYLYASLKLIYEFPGTSTQSVAWLMGLMSFSAICTLSIFMDGYSFVMHVSAFILIFIAAFFRDKQELKLKIEILTIFIGSTAFSYWLYTSYLGTSKFVPSSMAAFRGWGVDLTMLFSPSKGVLSLWDWLSLSVPRSKKIFFGDSSVWETTFCLPLLITGGLGFYRQRKSKFAVSLLLVTLLGFYLSLGPSLKMNSLRTGELYNNQVIDGGEMPESSALVATGSHLLSQNLPGFRNMRAAYRWSGLTLIGLFGLTTLLLIDLDSDRDAQKRFLATSLVCFLIASNCPNLVNKNYRGITHRRHMMMIDQEFSELSTALDNDDRVIFLPIGNDFLVNYIAAIGNYRTYNIGGDKNLDKARNSWPSSLRSIPMNEVGECLPVDIEQALRKGYVDAAILTYVDKLVDAHHWSTAYVDLHAKRRRFRTVMEYLEKEPDFDVLDWPLYSIVRLSPLALTEQAKNSDSRLKSSKVNIGSGCKARVAALEILDDGWYGLEENLVWSKSRSRLTFSPKNYFSKEVKAGAIKLSMSVYAALNSQPQRVEIYVDDQLYSSQEITNSDVRDYWINLPQLNLKKEIIHIDIQVPMAVSPASRNSSKDSRILGVGLREVEFVENDFPNTH